ncbi:hypothetical protein RvY_14608 [Ramazzottius varieornatus]|uniref:EamA domain-containing protein n=1 Tax=Ramazzottius varieornatus TaxID=947166 RepID=A0A1D1VTT6_RAMVA|nr:hypothetical protein RvY_14608 [Ramazzottius varieornatus]
MARKKEIFRTASSQVIVQKIRRMISVGTMQDTTEEPPVERLPDEFTHLKIRDVRSFAVGIVFICSISTCTGMLYNVTHRTESPTFYGPTLMLTIRAFYRIFTFPIFVALRWLYELVFGMFGKLRRRSLTAIIRDGAYMYGRPITITKFLVDICLLGSLTALNNILMFLPLFTMYSIGSYASLGAMSIVFVFFLSAFFLQGEVTSIKIFGAVLFLSAGTLLLLVEVIYNTEKWQQSVLVSAGAITTAVYQITFKRRVGGTTNLGRISFSVSLLAMVSMVLLWPAALGLKLVGIERWDIYNLPLEMLGKTSAAAWALVFLVNLGVSWTNPVFTSIGFLCVIPLSYMFNDIWNDRQPYGAIELTGSSLLALGYLILVFGDVLDWEHFKYEWKQIRGNTKWIWKKAEHVADRQVVREFKVAESSDNRPRQSIFELATRRVPDSPRENFSQLPVPGKFRRVTSTAVAPNVNGLQVRTGSSS